MPCYIITYDLNKEVNRPDIVGAIKKFEGWARLSESSYAVSTNLPPNAVFAILKPLLDANDNLYVISLRKPYCGFGPRDVNEWLEKNLPAPAFV